MGDNKSKPKNLRDLEWEKGKRENLKMEIKCGTVRKTHTENRKREEGRVLIRVNDVENPPIRAFSCAAG